ncbi:armadillo-type protein [Cercophora scortea]|uniref:Armadillo-type protein n=1 Tax=Cercophora scortea TaxID=314031 RepID=A0AAE0IH56_9PEZI|nr:armadillo-type protein [Cercophora scortea]
MDRARRRELREVNERAWNGETDLFPVGKSLDSTLKKNTAFIKRLRTAISPATLPTFLQEIRTVSLSKYLSEIISACYEGLCKLKSPGEIEAGVEIVSALHQRFGPAEFTEYLGWLLGKGMATPDKAALKTLSPEAREKEEKDRLVRQRVLLRVVTELWLVGVLRTLDDVSRPDDATKGATGKVTELKTRGSTKGGGAEPFPLEVLKDLLGHDREHVNLPLLVIFVKAFGWDVLGVKAAGSEGRKSVEEDGATKGSNGIEDQEDEASLGPDETPFTPPELQERFRNILKRYFDDVKNHLVRDQKAIFSQSRKNAEAYVKSGEVFEDRQSNFEKQVKAQERLVSNAQIIADIIGAEMPELKDSDDASGTANGSIGIVKAGEYLRGQGDGSGIWEDEEERRFYENLVDLKGKVPGILLEEVKKKKPDADEQVGKKIDAVDAADASKAAEAAAADDQSVAIANKTIGAQVDALLLRLPDLTNKEIIDQTAIDFCFLNSKASRNRLVKALTDVPKGRGDLLPSWSRLVATLGQYMPDIPKGLVDYLDSEFRSLQKRKEKEFLGQVRLSNIRYLAELTKFGIVPEHVVFHCLKVSIDDFSRMNIEIICNLLENCGRYLLRNPETSPRMASFLEILQRKKSVQHIGQAERMLIENAVYYVDPPQRPAIQQKERTPMELFIRKLIYQDLTKRNYSKVLRQIRRLHWEETEVVAILHKVFSKPGKVKYGNIHLLAILLSALYRYHADFVIGVIDHVVESICFGLEQNDFKFNQRRVAEVKYLGELYNYRMLEHPVVFDTMYKIMTFGHGGPPVPGRNNPFDMPDDFFRIRLISTLLETCGMFFNKGAAGKKLDYFLSFFQYYIFTKNPLPMDIDFIVQDIFSLTRPQWKLASNLEEASKVFQLAVAQDQKTTSLDKGAEQDDRTSGMSSDDDNGDGDDDDDSGSDEGDVEEIEQDVSARDSDSEEEEAIVVTRQEEEIDPEFEEDFEREYAKLMAESLDSRKFERKQQFDLPLPVRSKKGEAMAGNETVDSGPDQNTGGTMAFSLLTKRGNRQQSRTVELPSDSQFAIAMKTQQQAEKEEQRRIKNLVLNYDLRENEDGDGNEKPNPHYHNRADARTGKERIGQRVRKLQLSDVDWYDRPPQIVKNGSNLPMDDRRRGEGLAESRRRNQSMTSNHRMHSSTGTRRQLRLQKVAA